MRFIYVFLIWFVLLGGMKWFLKARSSHAVLVIPERVMATGQYRLEVTTTFAVAPDPFALVIDANVPPAALVVSLQGQEILKVTDRLEAGKAILVEPVPGLKEGRNEFFVKAHPPKAHHGQSHALRLRLLRDDVVVGEHSVWSIPPAPLVGAVVFDAGAESAENEHEHDEH